ncbi:hypothetical protein OXPF_21040 [Oxobacter pfennigii]|uniref:Uncharacterized protein n=1 Tax=Oxobacter pfennigii TaxID=36849 RepID=A0A0P8WN29_9CLOT|nr:hypothetical protein OXPF_21040 [Oxobacter pfennigii]
MVRSLLMRYKSYFIFNLTYSALKFKMLLSIFLYIFVLYISLLGGVRMKSKHRTFFYRIVTILMVLIFLLSVVGIGIELLINY